MSVWRLIDSGLCDAAYNMALDESIACAVRNGDAPPTLRFYGWNRPSVSIGSFQKLSDVDLHFCSTHTVPVVRRPTGGRGILHGDELTYSFSSRNEGYFSHGLLDTYRKISTALQAGLAMTGLRTTMKEERESGRNLTRSSLCFQSTSYGEISFDNGKLIGSAQKRWKDGFLQQGSIPYSIDYEMLAAVFVSKGQEIGDTGKVASPPAMGGLKGLVPDFEHEEFKKHLVASFEKVFSVRLIAAHHSAQEQALALQLSAEKYRNP